MNQQCKVCGEPAAGFHFGAFTCEGCKSFFGRTYNNLSQIHECKNGGVCIINKQNRTSCKACRLRKCLFVGMSKSGSRYGRRSNWFKIHCLLQEQASYTSPPSNFRTPATPTLQDGSLPFVAAQMKDPLGHPEQTTNLSSPSTLTSSPLVVTANSPVAGMHIGSLSPQIAQSYTHNSLLGHDRSLPEGIFRMTPRTAHVSPVNVTYRDNFINLLQRAHSIDPIRQQSSPEIVEESQRKHLSEYSRLESVSILGWEKRLRESSGKKVMSVLEENKPEHLPKEEKPTLHPQYKRKSFSVDSLRDSTNSPIHNDTLHYEIIRKSEHGNDLTTSKEEITEESKINLSDSNIHKPLMTDEERLNFLKNVNNVANSCRTVSDKVRPRPTDLRVPARDEVIYGQSNNNIFSFPPYPPMWPPMLPFNPFSKMYSPFCPPRLPPPLPFDAIKYPYAFLDLCHQQRNQLPIPTKEDPAAKKRILDAILQVQKERRSPSSRSSADSPENLPTYFRAQQSNNDTESSFSSSDQPIDLSVRRKRKMDKSEIMYKPLESSDHMEINDVERETEQSPSHGQLQEKFNQPRTISELYTSPEAPLKLIKLDSSQEPVST